MNTSNNSLSLSAETLAKLPSISFRSKTYAIETFLPALLLSTIQRTEGGALAPLLLLSTYKEYIDGLTNTKQVDTLETAIRYSLDQILHGEDTIYGTGHEVDKDEGRKTRDAIVQSARFREIKQILEEAKMRMNSPEHLRRYVANYVWDTVKAA